MDLPDGVMLAAPDGEPQGGASVPTLPTYRTRGEDEPVVDPAAALETPAESQPVTPLVANSDNPALDEAFNKLFMDGAPSLALPEVDTQIQPFLKPAAPEVSLPLAQNVAQSEPVAATKPATECAPTSSEAFISEPAAPQRHGDSLDQLLAQLSKTAPATSPQPPKPMESLGLLDEALIPPTVSQTEAATQPENKQPDENKDTWGLAPKEAPPLSSDWSLIETSPPSTAFAEITTTPDLLNLAEAGTPDLYPAHQEQEPIPAAPPIAPAAHSSVYQPGSSLTDILGAATAAASGHGASIAEGTPSFSSLSAPQAEQNQPTTSASKGSLLDTLLPPPSAESPQANQAYSAPPTDFSAKNEPQPETSSEWGFEGVQNISAPALDDFSLVPPAANNWGTENWGAEIQTDSLPEPKNTTDEWALPKASAPEYDPLEALAPPALNDLADHPTEELAIDEAEESWSEDDLLSESAQLNSSSNAYDLNHYDDPDEPGDVIELSQDEPDNAWTDEAAAADLDNLLSQLKKPQCDTHQAASTDIPTTHHAEEAPNLKPAPQPLDVSALFADEFEDEAEPESYALAPEPEHSTQPAAAQAQAAELTLSTEDQEPGILADYAALSPDKSQEKPGTEPTKTHQQAEAPLDRPHKTEAGEEQMLRLKGNKSAPEQSILEALSAKFIAYPREDSPNTKASEDAPALKSPDNLPKPKSEESPRHSSSPEQSLAAKIQPPSLSQALSNFEEETLLKETRFVRQSINNLVDRYFAQQEQDNSY